jgi:hypothetical protein
MLFFSKIILLLRASDSLVNDLCHGFYSCDDKTAYRPSTFYLALRKWYDLRPVNGVSGVCSRGFAGGGFPEGSYRVLSRFIRRARSWNPQFLGFLKST